MRGKMTILHVNGTTTTKNLDGTPSLEMLQEAVGGMIETVPYFDTYMDSPCVAFCDEEGKIKGKPLNPDATTLWRKILQADLIDVLVGDICIVQGDDEFLSRL